MKKKYLRQIGKKKKKERLRGSWGHVVLDGKYGYFYPIKLYILMLNLGYLMDFLLNMSLV